MPNRSLRRHRTLQGSNSSFVQAKSVSVRYIPSSQRVEDRKSYRSVDPHSLARIRLHAIDAISMEESSPETIRLPRMVRMERRNTGKEADVTVVFAIRRPGCGACRIHARSLVKVLQHDPDLAVVGVVKHIKDKEACRDFQSKYFNNLPLYCDRSWAIFKALGNRKISSLKLLKSAPRLTKTYKAKKVENIPFGGDIWTQGGVLVFDRHGNLRYTYYENYGQPLDINEIRAAIAMARAEPLPRHVDRRYKNKELTA